MPGSPETRRAFGKSRDDQAEESFHLGRHELNFSNNCGKQSQAASTISIAMGYDTLLTRQLLGALQRCSSGRHCSPRVPLASRESKSRKGLSESGSS